MHDELILDGVPIRVRTFSAAGQRVEYFEVSDVDVALERAIETGGLAPYGAVPWASAFLFAERLAHLSLSGKTIVDVGAGCGVVSLMASKLGARVIALEIDALARSLLVRAATRQSLDVEVRDFDVGSDEPLPEGDLYIFADLLYEEELADLAAERVIEVCEQRRNVWVGDPKRTGRHTFQKRLLARAHPCEFREISMPVPDLEPLQHVGVYAHAPGGWADVW